MVEIVVANVVFVVMDAGHGLKPRLEGVRFARLRAFHGAELALPDQPLAEVGKERQIVGAKESREGKFIVRCRSSTDRSRPG